MNADLRNRIAGVTLMERGEQSRLPFDNLAIILCTYFDADPDCPDEESGEDGWKPWVVERANAMLDEIAKAVTKEIP